MTSLNNIIHEDVAPGYGRVAYLGFSLLIKKDNGYVNATHLCAQSEKKREFRKWSRLDNAIDCIENVATILNMVASDLTQVPGGLPNELRGTYVHPHLVNVIAQWASPMFSIHASIIIDKWRHLSSDNNIEYFRVLTESMEHERTTRKRTLEETVSDAIAAERHGQREVATRFGFIDVLTPTHVIEVKRVHLWKHALGQVLAYAHEYPDHEKTIVLFETDDADADENISKIAEFCKSLNVVVEVYDANKRILEVA